MTGYENIDRCDNKLKSSKHTVKSIFSNFFLGFSETFTIRLPQVKILADLGEGVVNHCELPHHYVIIELLLSFGSQAFNFCNHLMYSALIRILTD